MVNNMAGCGPHGRNAFTQTGENEITTAVGLEMKTANAATESTEKAPSKSSDDSTDAASTDAKGGDVNRLLLGVKMVKTFGTDETATTIADGEDVPRSATKRRLDAFLGWRHWRIVLHLALWIFVTRYVGTKIWL